LRLDRRTPMRTTMLVRIGTIPTVRMTTPSVRWRT